MTTFAQCVLLSRLNHLDLTYDIASYSLLIYDYLLTVDDEKTLIWSTSWTVAKFLYLVNRYIPFIDGALVIYVNFFGQDLSFKSYSTLHETAGVFIYIGSLFAEAIVLFRTWALYGCRPRVGLALLVFAVSLTCGGVFFSFSAIRPSNNVTTTCDRARSVDYQNDQRVFVDYIFIIVHETVLLGLTFYKCFNLLKTKRSTFISSLFKDGIMYYTYILAASVINVGFIEIYNDTGRFILFQHILHSIFATRILLDLRVAARRYSEDLAFSNPPSTISNANGFLSTVVAGAGTWVHTISGKPR